MGSTLRIALVSVNIILALLVFQSGFLLKRQEISQKSSCSDAHALPGQTCWMDQQYKRVILIVIDALRYDFLQPLTRTITNVSTEEQYYRGQMKNVAELVMSGNASIGTLLADPPTTTLQRLKALTTGTLPTFIDAGDNFSPDASVNEDNFVYQAAALGKNVTLLGDDTWLSLYPNQFSKSEAYESFDINDLNTVDDKITPSLAKEVASKNSSSIIIAHFLGVDHCGHKYGPSNAVMTATLKKMDNVIGNTVKSMRDDDLLIVIGDHGMTATGDHGGESELEIQAGVLVHSKKQHIRLPLRPIHQIDIVPSISLLMGLPIPFSNLGSVVVELFPRELWETAVGMNYEQIKRFAETYARKKDFGELHTHTARDSNTMEEQIDTISRIQTTLRVAWTQFDDAYINAGIFSLIEAMTFLMTNEHFSNEWIVFRTGCGFLQAALLSDKTDSDGNAHTLLLMALSISCLSSLFVFAQRALQLSIASLWTTRTLGWIFVLLHSVSLFSNSFVVYEAKCIRYLLQALIILVHVERLRKLPKPKRPYKLFYILNFRDGLVSSIFLLGVLRLEPVFHRCREEEVDCHLHDAVKRGSSLAIDAQIGRLLTSIGMLVVANYAVFNALTKEKKKKISAKTRLLSSMSWPTMSLVTYHQILVALNQTETALFIAPIILVVGVVGAIIALFDNSPYISATYIMYPIFLLFGDGLAPAIVFYLVLSKMLKDIMPISTRPSALSLLAPFGFYFLGNSPVISSIPWHAAFVGVPGTTAFRIIPAICVLVHLNLSAISTVFAAYRQTREILKEALILMTLRATFSCIAASIHRRHLMVWKIFAPKFIFECVLCIVFILFVNVVCIVKKNQIQPEEREKTQ